MFIPLEINYDELDDSQKEQCRELYKQIMELCTGDVVNDLPVILHAVGIIIAKMRLNGEQRRTVFLKIASLATRYESVYI